MLQYFSAFRSIVLFCSLFFVCSVKCLVSHEKSHRFYLGPEFYHSHRTRENGTVQNGYLYGGEGGYERFKRNAVYWGIKGYSATGTLRGKTGPRLNPKTGVQIGNKPIKSHLTDNEIEGRIGYTLQYKKWWQPFFTPFAGAGYFSERNRFVSPSAILVTSKIHFKFVSLGFLSGFYFTPRCSLGVNLDAKFMLRGKNDMHEVYPNFRNSPLLMEDETQYEVELPFAYQMSENRKWLLVSAVPFYRFRHYGGRENYPFDFNDTKFQIFGGKFYLIFRF